MKPLLELWYSDQHHGRFGWKGDALQRAMDNRCFGEVCEGLPTQTPEQAAKCTKPVDVDEDIDSCEIPMLGSDSIGSN